MPKLYKPPRETVAAARGAPLRSVVIAMLCCAFAGAALGADAALTWAEALPIHPISDAVVEAAAAWRDFLRAVGLGDPAAAIRDSFRSVQNYRR